MKNLTDVIWGIVFIAIAVIFALYFLDIWTFPLFDCWWTLFIIVPSLIALTKKEGRAGGLFGLILGVLLLLSSNDIIDFSSIWKIVIVVILLAIGLKLIFSRGNMPELAEDNKEVTAIFSENNVYYNENQEFKDCSSKAIFGGVDLDLRDAKISSDGKINVISIFGGTDIHVPRNVNLEIDSTGIFGGVKNYTSNNKSDNEFTIYINAIAIFGGVDIK